MTSSHLLGPGLTYIGGSGENYDKELIQFSLEREFKRMSALGIKYVGCWADTSAARMALTGQKLIYQAISTINMMADQAEKYGMEIALEPQVKKLDAVPEIPGRCRVCKNDGTPQCKGYGGSELLPGAGTAP